MTVRISDRYVVTAAVSSAAGRPLPRDHIAFHLSGSCGTLKPTTSRTDRHGRAATQYRPGRVWGNCVISASDPTGARAFTVFHNRPCRRAFGIYVTVKPRSLPSDSTSTAAVSAYVGDCGGIYGLSVTFDLSGSACGSISPTSGITDLDGQVQATYRASTTPGDCIIRAWVSSNQYGQTSVSQTDGSPGEP